MRINKRGGAKLGLREFMELVLAGAVIVILVWLMWSLIAPSFDKDKETAESYMKTLKSKIAKADAGNVGEFEIWQPEEKKGIHFFLVYFGEAQRFGDFLSIGNHENRICICYIKDSESTCDSCFDLKNPAKDKVGYAPWSAKQGDKLEITKDEESYLFLNSS